MGDIIDFNKYKKKDKELSHTTSYDYEQLDPEMRKIVTMLDGKPCVYAIVWTDDSDGIKVVSKNPDIVIESLNFLSDREEGE